MIKIIKGQVMMKLSGLEYIESFRNYIDYLEEHLINIGKAYNEVTEKCKDIDWFKENKEVLRDDVIRHDLSKFSKEEFTQYAAKFYPVKNTTQNITEFENAWEHHYKHNHHHIETYSNLYDFITKLNLVHMVIDWTAMSYKFGGSAQEYYESDKCTKEVNEKDKDFLYLIFSKLK